MARRDPYGFFLRCLRNLIDKYEGRCVVVAKVVAHGPDGTKVHDVARSTHPRSKILLGQVQTKEDMVL
jgi:hypothetical protein